MLSTKSGQKKWFYYEKFTRWSMMQAYSLRGVFQHLTQGGDRWGGLALG
jgi:hypothetical protein